MAKKAIITAIIISILLAAWIIHTRPAQPTVVFDTKNGVVTVNVEVASTTEQQERGLMFRKSLGADRGMLFTFSDTVYRSFWMRNTLIPLDMIFLGEDLRIVNIVYGATPCIAEPCDLYESRYPVKYVVEVNAGYCRKHGISVGDKVLINGNH